MRQDYHRRQGRPLSSGAPSQGKMFNPVEVLGCVMFMDEDDLTVEGTPVDGEFKLQYDGFETDAIPYNAAAATVETELNDLFAANDIEIVVECTGGPLPDTPVTITTDPASDNDFMPSKLKCLFGKLEEGTRLSNLIWSGTDPLYCAVLSSAGALTFEVIEAKPLNGLYARGVRTTAIKVADKWLLMGSGGTWYASVVSMVDFGDEGLQIQFDHGGPAGKHKAHNDTNDDESAWSDGDELFASPFNGTWHVLLKNCPGA